MAQPGSWPQHYSDPPTDAAATSAEEAGPADDTSVRQRHVVTREALTIFGLIVNHH
ncbi:hypothetical protein MAPG_08734 [Magnaporthiopsis poae ATCC 64411]|uniref:Uncharacterized protein n=1 Tax=Magnaporthiopsis poae (strain ATCC 64411 / 73-15) TaxID=644358 RepID=A0A0C4E846_MAGP6|nr:hypothetical protein MAPG_08734 [Magnaporthiopsis poae ATCC 64411]